MINYFTFMGLFDAAFNYSSEDDFLENMVMYIDPTTCRFKKHKSQEPQTYKERFKDSYDEVVSNIYMCASAKSEDEFTKALESISGYNHCTLLQTSEPEYQLYVRSRKIRGYMAYIAITYSLLSKEQ